MQDVDTGSTPSDAELITRVRGGDRLAYGALYRRHAPAAANLARQFSYSGSDSDDLVSESFARVLDTLLDGRGPDTAFRAYLFTTLRHTAYDRGRKDKKLHFTDDLAPYEKPSDDGDPVIKQLENSFIARAFQQLPERWQVVLWHTQVEGQSAAEVGELLGIAPNAVSSLSFRAREGLREAYLQVHVAECEAQNCRTTIGRLGAWTRGGLSKRERAQVDSHLEICDTCPALAAELAEINSDLRALIAPIFLGLAAAGYLSALPPAPVIIQLGSQLGNAATAGKTLSAVGASLKALGPLISQPIVVISGLVAAVVATVLAFLLGGPDPSTVQLADPPPAAITQPTASPDRTLDADSSVDISVSEPVRSASETTLGAGSTELGPSRPGSIGPTTTNLLPATTVGNAGPAVTATTELTFTTAAATPLPDTTGPIRTGPITTGLTTTGPSATGSITPGSITPTTTAPESTDPASTEPTEPTTTGPITTGPTTAESSTTEPITTGQITTGPTTTESSTEPTDEPTTSDIEIGQPVIPANLNAGGTAMIELPLINATDKSSNPIDLNLNLPTGVQVQSAQISLEQFGLRSFGSGSARLAAPVEPIENPCHADQQGVVCSLPSVAAQSTSYLQITVDIAPDAADGAIDVEIAGELLASTPVSFEPGYSSVMMGSDLPVQAGTVVTVGLSATPVTGVTNPGVLHLPKQIGSDLVVIAAAGQCSLLGDAVTCHPDKSGVGQLPDCRGENQRQSAA